MCGCECEMRECVGTSEMEGESEERKQNSAFRLDRSSRIRLKMETMILCTRLRRSNFPKAQVPGLLFSVE